MAGVVTVPVDQLGLYLQRSSVALQSNGSLVIANRCFRGSIDGICLYRISHGGDFDTTFGESGIAFFASGGQGTSTTDVAVAADDALFVATDCSDAGRSEFCLVKFTPDGLVDGTFARQGAARISVSSGSHRAAAVRVDPRDRLVIVGDCDRVGHPLAFRDFCAARVLADGTLDSAFATDGVLSANTTYVHDNKVMDLTVDSEANLVALSQCRANQVSVPCLYKFDSLGRPDSTFGRDGIFEQPMSLGDFITDAYAMAPAADRGYYYTSECAAPDGKAFCVVKLLASGTFDESFAHGGVARIGISTFDLRGAARPNKVFFDAVAQKITVGGICYVRVEGSYYAQDLCLARFLSDGRTDSTYGSGGRVTHTLQLNVNEFAFMFVERLEKLTVAFVCSRYGFFTNPSFCLARLKGGPYDASSCAYNIDADAEVAGGDGVLAVRYLLGLRGAALTDGAVGPNPGRSNAEIETYLADLLAQGKLDADGDGQSLAMTDGLLILRAMLGLTGDALTAGAVNTAHPNARNAQQILTWIESTHGVACLP